MASVTPLLPVLPSLLAARLWQAVAGLSRAQGPVVTLTEAPVSEPEEAFKVIVPSPAVSEDIFHFMFATARAPAQTGEMSWRKKPYEEVIANHFDPESCVGLSARAAAKR